MWIKNNEKLKAIKLRRQGKSYSEIYKRILVSKSTISTWLKNVPLNKKQEDRLLKLRIEGAKRGASKRRLDRISSSKSIIKEAWNETPILINNPLFVLGLSLYWGEGTKATESLRLSNSDPFLIQCYMKWLREFCRIDERKIRIHIHIHSLHSRAGIEEYWSSIIRIPLKQFTKTYIKKTSLKQRKNKLYNGTCVIEVLDIVLYRKIIGWHLGILEHLNLITPSNTEKNKIIDNAVQRRSMKNIPIISNAYGAHSLMDKASAF